VAQILLAVTTPIPSLGKKILGFLFAQLPFDIHVVSIITSNAYKTTERSGKFPLLKEIFLDTLRLNETGTRNDRYRERAPTRAYKDGVHGARCPSLGNAIRFW